jgi:hypothetical protein
MAILPYWAAKNNLAVAKSASWEDSLEASVDQEMLWEAYMASPVGFLIAPALAQPTLESHRGSVVALGDPSATLKDYMDSRVHSLKAPPSLEGASVS